MTVIRTDRLTLRRPGPADLESFTAFLGSKRSVHVGGPKDRNLAWRSFATICGHWTLRGYGSFIFVEGDEATALGMVGPWHPEGWPEREIAWPVWSPEAEGRGFAREAAAAAIAHVFRDLGWQTAVSYIDPENARPVALAKRLGAVLDEDAPSPDTDPVLVYRHPAPETLQ